MPPRTALRANALRAIGREPYVCPSCLLKESGAQTALKSSSQPRRTLSTDSGRVSTRQSKRIEQHRSMQSRRNASNGSLASSTAVNAPTAVPPELRDLHQQLQLLQDKASIYIDLSRLQLALRSLESKDPIIRIAFLGLGTSGVQAARRLARLLLSDELADEAQWERDLLEERDGRSVLLKYGEASEESGVQAASSPMVKELLIPSNRLRSWNVEILVTGLNASGYTASDSAEAVKELEESVLVPPVTMPNSAGGRVGFVRYPVHKALIVADGISGAVEFGRLPAMLADGNMINAALNLPLRVDAGKDKAAGDSAVKPISVELAESALGLLRKDYRANGALYSSRWQESRLPSTAAWLAAASGSGTNENGLKPAVNAVLTSVLSRSATTISAAESTADEASDKVPDAKRTALHSAISSWSEESHRDLQMNLTAALMTMTWRRTTWWRLFWRIDEVSMSASDVLRRGWLVDAEQSLAFVSGRVLEAGLASEEDLKNEPTDSAAEARLLPGVPKEEWEEYKASHGPDAPPQKIESLADLTDFPLKVSRIKEESGLDVFFDPPWPQTIHLAREQMLHQLVPSMHRKAQALLMTSLSTIGGSGALGGWLWLASGGVALYEAGAIAALGLVWALRRLQTKWSKERNQFTEIAREDARRVLADVEGKLRRLVNEGGRVSVNEEDRREWVQARAAVEACQRALKKAKSVT